MAKNDELFVNCPIPMRTLVSTLSNKDLDGLCSLVWFELNARIDTEIASGKLTPMTEQEKALVNTNRMAGINAYRARTSCSLLVAKKMIDAHYNASC